MPLVNAVLSALLNLVLLAGIPFLFYFAFHRWRRKRRLAEIAGRAGLRPVVDPFFGYCAAFAAVVVAALLIWAPPLEPFVREGSPQREFVGLGLGGPAIAMALLYGVVKTGFAEEFLFRGLIAGSLGRRLSLPWANVLQALIFLLPHFLVLSVMPEMWGLLLLVFAGALFVGWARIKSGSILGPWLAHAAVNVTMCLSVAARTAA